MSRAYATDKTLQSAVSASANGGSLAVVGLSTVAFQVTGTFVATVTFEGTIDASTWVSVLARNVATGAVATTATAAGVYVAACGGLSLVRARVTWTSGTSITVITLAQAVGMGDAAYAKLLLADGVAPQIDDTDKLAVSLYGQGTVAGDSALLVQSAAVHNLRVILYSGAAQIDSLAPTQDGQATGAWGLSAVGRPYKYNGANWDRVRNNNNVTLLASAARTAATDSADQTNYNAQGLVLVCDVSAITATPVLTLSIQVKDSISGNYLTVWTAAATVAAVGTTAYLFQPGGAAGSYTEAVNLRVPRTWRLHIAVADADSATYSVSAVLLV